MASLILIKRGLEANLPILERGELAFATDTKRLFIGVLAEPTQVSDNVLISSIDDFYTKTETASLVGTGLLWDSQAEEFNIVFASEEEAQTGTNTTRVMNPLRTADAITAQTSAILTTGQYVTETHLDNTIASLGGTGLTVTEGIIDIDNPFNPSGDFTNLRARATTAEDVGLDNVTNESKTTMFDDPTFTGTVTVPDPVNSTDAANKRYVDELAEGLITAPAVHAATTGNLSGTYDNGTAGVGATFNLGVAETLTIDGESIWVLDDGLLIKDQTNKAENGRYTLTQVGDGSTDWIFTRSTIADEAYEIPGRYVFVIDGTANLGTGWVQIVDDPNTFTVGTDDIDVYQFSGAGTYTAGSGLTLTGNEFTIDTAVTMDLGSAQTVTGIKTFNETIVGAVTGIQETNTEENNRIMSVWVGTESEYNTQTNTGANADNNTLYFIEE